MKYITLFCMLLFISSALIAQDDNSLFDERDGKTYKTVKVGDQLWMAQNLNFENGNSICYKKKEANCEKYGKIYGSRNIEKVCPAGWHLPSKEEVEKMLKVSTGKTDFFTYRGLTRVPIYMFKNFSELNIQYGGKMTLSGKYEDEKKYVSFFTSTSLGKNKYATYNYDKESFELNVSEFGDYSCYVRCVKD
ncbi:MAG: FISUMP domain-containing protein [Bacteroidales bacterium]